MIPEFYARDQRGNSHGLGGADAGKHGAVDTALLANRTVREYTEQHYLPAATAYHLRSANKGAIGREIVAWQHSLEQKWAALHFGELRVATHAKRHIFEAEVYLNDPTQCGTSRALC